MAVYTTAEIRNLVQDQLRKNHTEHAHEYFCRNMGGAEIMC